MNTDDRNEQQVAQVNADNADELR